MNKYIQNIFNNAVPDNKGYRYIRTEDIYLPIFKVSLLITKRKQTSLNLVEEIVLKILECNITDLDEVAGILGLTRDILDITVADLYVKDLVYPTANKCVLKNKGRKVLQELVTYKKETDIIRNLYINSLNREIYTEKFDSIINRCEANNNKLHHVFNGQDIEFYRTKINVIREIFDKNNALPSDYMGKSDELISIDGIEDFWVCYLKMPINIYVSETGTDIDLSVNDSKLHSIFENIKITAVEQIRKHLLLNNLFTRYTVELYQPPQGQFEDPSAMESLIQEYATDKMNRDTNFKILSDKIFFNRILIENEFEKLFALILPNTNLLEFYINNLDYWSKDSKFITLLSMIPNKINYCLSYNTVGNLRLSRKRFRNSVPQLQFDNISRKAHDHWFKMRVDNTFEIEGIPINIPAIDDTTYVIKVYYYFHRLI